MRSAPHDGRRCTPPPRRSWTTRPSPCAIGWPPRPRGTPPSPPASAEVFLRHAWERCGPETEPEVVATIALQYAVHRYGRLDAAGAVEWCRRALDRTGPDTATRQTAQTYLAHSLGYSGRIDEAL